MTADVCVVGSANLDLVATTDRIPSPGETVLATGFAEHAGGKGLNQAVAASRSGAQVTFVGAVGDDAAGHRLRSTLADDRIDARVATVGAPTGRALITVDDGGENSIVVVSGANRLVSLDQGLPSASVLLCQLEIPVAVVADAFARARQSGTLTVLNPAPAVALPTAVLTNCDIVVPNEHEIGTYGGPDGLLDAGCRAVVVTLGARGAEIFTASDRRRVAAPHVEVVDTTGAGDAFCGSLAARLATDAPITPPRDGAGIEMALVHDAVCWAVVAGALATTVAGAVPAQPDAARIAALLHATG